MAQRLPPPYQGLTFRALRLMSLSRYILPGMLLRSCRLQICMYEDT